MIVSHEHYQRTFNFRVDAVVLAALQRNEKLYKPSRRFEPSTPIIWDVSSIPREKNKFNSVEDALAAVKHWCR
jgi:hypothetical protein